MAETRYLDRCSHWLDVLRLVVQQCGCSKAVVRTSARFFCFSWRALLLIFYSKRLSFDVLRFPGREISERRKEKQSSCSFCWTSIMGGKKNYKTNTMFYILLKIYINDLWWPTKGSLHKKKMGKVGILSQPGGGGLTESHLFGKISQN